jgi:hypothetical protein
MSEKLTMPKNVQSFVNKYGRIGSKEQDATFWKEFRKAANAYANVQAKRICDLEHALTAVTEQRDEALFDLDFRRELYALLAERCDRRTVELAETRAQRDRLAAVLQRIRDGYGGQVASPNCCEDCDYLLPIDEALQSLTQKP